MQLTTYGIGAMALGAAVLAGAACAPDEPAPGRSPDLPPDDLPPDQVLPDDGGAGALLDRAAAGDAGIAVENLARAYIRAYGADAGSELALDDQMRRTDAHGQVRDATRLFARADALGDGDGSATTAEVQSVLDITDLPDTFQAMVGRDDGRLSEDELQFIADVVGEQDAGAPTTPEEVRIADLAEDIDAVVLTYFQRYDASVDGRIALRSETMAQGYDATRLLTEADVDGDGEVIPHELAARLRQLDTDHHVLGGWARGADGKLGSAEDVEVLWENG